MRRLPKFIVSAAAALTFGVSHADPINVGGVVWDPGSFFDFTSTDSMIENVVGGVGDELRGYAKIDRINQTEQNVFCPGCEVTYEFFGYIVSNVAADGSLTFTGGTINVYVDDSPNYDALFQSTATDGVLFLTLTGHSYTHPDTGFTGTLHSDATPTLPTTQGHGEGFLDVTGGLAAAFFDTNPFNTGSGFADLSFTSSFQLLSNGSFVSDDGVTYALFGSNDLQGRTQAVPEPGVLSLLSVALFGFGFLLRRKIS